ncbi:unnamed protein product [Ixodes pacificus]
MQQFSILRVEMGFQLKTVRLSVHGDSLDTKQFAHIIFHSNAKKNLFFQVSLGYFETLNDNSIAHRGADDIQ